MAEVGAHLADEISADPSLLHAASKVVATIYTGGEDVRDALPLPVTRKSAEDFVHDRYEGDERNVMRGLAGWLWIISLSLNLLWGKEAKLATPSPIQEAIMLDISDRVSYFMSIPEGRINARCWEEYLRSQRISYSGELVAKALPLTWEQMEPGLPPPDRCGALDAAALAEGPMAEFLRDPSVSIPPHNPKDLRPNPGKVRFARGEELRIGRGLLARGLVTALRSEDLKPFRRRAFAQWELWRRQRDIGTWQTRHGSAPLDPEFNGLQLASGKT